MSNEAALTRMIDSTPKKTWSYLTLVSEWYVGSTRGSGIVSSAADMLWMSVVRGMRGVGGSICDVYVFGSGRRGWREGG